jgi:branched-chain amino acid transport system permease protein
MGLFLQAVWGGILFGSVYGLMALGLTMIWGTLNLLNLAHGAIFVLAAYVAFALGATFLHLPVLLTFALAIVAAGVLGMLMYTGVVRPMLGRPGWNEAAWIATLGISLIIENAALVLFGGETRAIPTVLSGALRKSGVVITFQGIFVVVVAISALLILNFFLRRSRHGLAIRAISQDGNAARLMGVRVQQAFLIVLVVSAALAGLAGVLLSSTLYLSPTSGLQPMLLALIVTIFGGLGSVKGTILAAYIVGTIEAFAEVYVGVGLALPILFVFIIAVLIIRPNGLFGTVEGSRL